MADRTTSSGTHNDATTPGPRDVHGHQQMMPPFEKPKLKYIPPKLVKQATVEDVTAGFFGPFYPPA